MHYTIDLRKEAEESDCSETPISVTLSPQHFQLLRRRNFERNVWEFRKIKRRERIQRKENSSGEQSADFIAGNKMLNQKKKRAWADKPLTPEDFDEIW